MGSGVGGVWCKVWGVGCEVWGGCGVRVGVRGMGVWSLGLRMYGLRLKDWRLEFGGRGDSFRVRDLFLAFSARHKCTTIS